MIDLEQNVELKWNNSYKKYFVGLGYEFTHIGDAFTVKAKELRPSSGALVAVKCDKCGIEKHKKYGEYLKIVSKSGLYRCRSCTTSDNDRARMPKEKYFQIFLDFCEKYDYIPLSTIDDYQTEKTKLRYVCKKHGEKTITVDSIDDYNVGCRECSYEVISRKNKYDINEVISIIESKGNKLLNPDEYVGVKTNNLKIMCGGCGEIFTTSLESQIFSQGSCKQCGIKKVAKAITLTPKYLNEFYNSGGKQILLNPQDYINNSTPNLKFVCLECGETFITSKANYDFGTKLCSKCNHTKSSGERIVEDYLKAHDIEYTFQKRFDDCKDKRVLPFDYYLEKINIVVEFDGRHHFEPIYGDAHFESTQKHDKIKNEYCDKNGIKIIRIPYWDGHKINEILDTELSNIEM